MKKALIWAASGLCLGMVYAETTEASWYWRLDVSAKTLTNVSSDESQTNWVLKISQLDLENKTFTVGAGSGVGNGYTCKAQTYADGSVTNIIVGSGKMDLSTPIYDLDNEPWAATAIGEKGGQVFGTPTGSPHALTEFIFPKTVKKLYSEALRPNGWDNSIITRITMECPELEEIPPSCCNSLTKLTYLLLKCPKVKTIGNRAFREVGTLSDTNVDDWDLSGLETLKGESQHAGAFSYMTIINGTLRLPNIKIIERGAFYAGRHVQLNLGFNRTLEYVGYDALTTGETSSTCPTIVFCPSPNGWKMEAGAMQLSDYPPKQIVFLGALPQPLKPGESWFKYPDKKELKTCFYLNDEFPECKAILEAASPVTEAQIFAFTNNNPLVAAPCGIVSPSVFNTAYPQFVGRADLKRYLTPQFSYGVYADDHDYGDGVELESTDAEVTFGSVVTLKPVIAEGNTFAEWVGAPEDAVIDPVTHNITFKIGYASVDVKLRTFHSWRLLKPGEEGNETTTNRITDGNWLLNVWGDGTTGRRLQLGTNAEGSAYAGQGSGILDLNGPILDSDGNNWTVTRLGSASLRVKEGGRHVITDLILSTNLTYVGTDTFAVYNKAENPLTLRRLVMDIPFVTDSLYNGFEEGQNALEDLVLRAPQLKQIGQYTFREKPLLKKDASEWQLDSLERIYATSFVALPNVYGTLRLPSLLAATNCIYETGIEAIELGMAYTNAHRRFTKALSFGNGSWGVLRGNTALASVLFGPYAEINLDDASFRGCTALKTVVFTGRPVAREMIDTILQSVPTPSDGAIKTAIYVSAALDWNNADYVTAIASDDAEAPHAAEFEATLGEEERLLGIYNAKDKTRKAWIVHRPSVCDPKGTILIFR